MSHSGNLSLQQMLEAVDALVQLLEVKKKLLVEHRELPGELLERIQLAGRALDEIVERLRRDPSEGSGDPERARLRKALEERFVIAFRLTRENEQLLRNEAPKEGRIPAGTAGDARPSLREIERRYRERMRPGPSPRTPGG